MLGSYFVQRVFPVCIGILLSSCNSARADQPTGVEYIDKAGAVCSKVGTLSRNGSGTITLEGIEYKFEGNGAFEAYLGASLISKDKYFASDYYQCLKTLTEFFIQLEEARKAAQTVGYQEPLTILKTVPLRKSNIDYVKSLLGVPRLQKNSRAVFDKNGYQINVRYLPDDGAVSYLGIFSSSTQTETPSAILFDGQWNSEVCPMNVVVDEDTENLPPLDDSPSVDANTEFVQRCVPVINPVAVLGTSTLREFLSTKCDEFFYRPPLDLNDPVPICLLGVFAYDAGFSEMRQAVGIVSLQLDNSGFVFNDSDKLSDLLALNEHEKRGYSGVYKTLKDEYIISDGEAADIARKYGLIEGDGNHVNFSKLKKLLMALMSTRHVIGFSIELAPVTVRPHFCESSGCNFKK